MYSGIDVSVYQGDIQWKKVKEAGVEFAMLRAGWSWYQGGMNIDKNFQAYAAGAGEAGLPWGAYLYAYDKTPEAARISARRLAQVLAPYRPEYPVAYDIEDMQYLYQSRAENTAIAKAFLEELQSLGFYVMLYTFTNFANGYLDMSQLSQFDLWVADHRAQVGYNGPYGMWQYSNSGRVDGISVNVDLDRAYKDYPVIIRAAGLNGFGTGGEGGDDCQARLQELQEKLERLKEEQSALEADYRQAQTRIENALRALEG